jgi:hypothetical protein
MTGLADYGYSQPAEIDAFRAGEAGAEWVQDSLLSSDATAPDRVGDLQATAIGNGQVTLTWTAPGDDGSQGTAAHYTLHGREGALTASTWSSPGAVVLSTAAPQPGGQQESMTVTVPHAGSWTFGIKATDEIPHTSPVSNTVTVAVS